MNLKDSEIYLKINNNIAIFIYYIIYNLLLYYLHID